MTSTANRIASPPVREGLRPDRAMAPTRKNIIPHSSKSLASSRRERPVYTGRASEAGRAETGGVRHQSSPPSGGRAGASRAFRQGPGSRVSKVWPDRRSSPQTRSTRSRVPRSPARDAMRLSRAWPRLREPR